MKKLSSNLERMNEQAANGKTALFPKVDVIIPNYNSRGDLLYSLDSVAAQTTAVNEIIVIDDHSALDEQVFLQTLTDRFENLRIVTMLKNTGGPSQPRNLGIDISTADYVSFLDSGDTWLADKIERQKPFLQAGYAAVIGNYYVQKRGVSKQSIVASPEVISFAMQSKRNFVGSPTGVVKRALSPRYHEIGHEDYLYWIEVTRMTSVRNCGGAPVAIHYREDNSRSSQLMQNVRSVFVVFRYAGLSWPLFKTIRYSITGLVRRAKVWIDTSVN